VFGTALNALVPVNAEGQNQVDVEGDGWGYNAGVLFDLSPATRLGLGYRSTIEYELSGTTRFSGVPAAFALSPALTAATANGNVRLDVKTPDMASAALLHRITPDWDVLADVTWTGWSNIKALPLVRETGATLDTLRFNFKDTLRYGIGASYRRGSAWTFKVGVAFDESPVPGAADRSVRLPDNDRTWLSVGAKYRLSRNAAIDAGLSFIKVKDAPIDNNQNLGNVRGRVNGSYEAHVSILSVQYAASF
jgi:long-chain fatty acid transport protein